MGGLWLGDPSGSRWQPIEIRELPGEGLGGFAFTNPHGGPGVAVVIDVTAVPVASQADLWLVASADGVEWLVEDLDEGGAEEGQWRPERVVVNGAIVLVGEGDSLTRYSLP